METPTVGLGIDAADLIKEMEEYIQQQAAYDFTGQPTNKAAEIMTKIREVNPSKKKRPRKGPFALRPKSQGE